MPQIVKTQGGSGGHRSGAPPLFGELVVVNLLAGQVGDHEVTAAEYRVALVPVVVPAVRHPTDTEDDRGPALRLICWGRRVADQFALPR